MVSCATTPRDFTRIRTASTCRAWVVDVETVRPTEVVRMRRKVTVAVPVRLLFLAKKVTIVDCHAAARSIYALALVAQNQTLRSLEVAAERGRS